MGIIIWKKRLNQHLLNLDVALHAAQFHQFTFLTSVRDLGATLDNTLSFSAYISNLSRSSFHHLCCPGAIRLLFPCIYLRLWSMHLSVPGLTIRPLSAISDRPLRPFDHNDILVPRSRTSTSQKCAFASLWLFLLYSAPS